MNSESATRPQILIVDDQPANLLALRRLLEHHDADVFEATSGNAALGLALDHDFALALVDVNMPVMNGYEVAELMRGAPLTRNVPVIFLTAAYADETHRRRGYLAGAVDYIEKPIFITIAINSNAPPSASPPISNEARRRSRNRNNT